MKLYYADFSSMDLEELLKEYTDKVDKHRQSKITRTQAPAARVRSLLAGYLLQCAVKDALNIDKAVLEFAYGYNEQGKPYLKDYPQIHFSLSHSGNVVACVVSEQEIGLDVQEHVKVNKRLAERFFTEKENILLKAQPDEGAYRELFFRLWSIKESYIKYTGLGMKQGLDTFEIDWENKTVLEKNASIKGAEKTITDGNLSACFEEITLEGLTEYAVNICVKVREPVTIIKKELKCGSIG